MDWKDYARTARQYRERFGCMPPTILTEEGTLRVMKEALAHQEPVNCGVQRRADVLEPNGGSRH
jgi:hypothetical protein